MKMGTVHIGMYQQSPSFMTGSSQSIYGIGTDICDIGRIGAALQRQGERFAQKILTPTEQVLWQTHAQRSTVRATRYLATRFSAKEAFAKAIGLGMVQPMSWHGCEISTLASGQPQIVLHGPLRWWFEQRHLRAHLSLSDEKDYAVSFCLIEIQTCSKFQKFQKFKKSTIS